MRFLLRLFFFLLPVLGQVDYYGRYDLLSNGAQFDWSGVSWSHQFSGSSVSMLFQDNGANQYAITVDGKVSVLKTTGASSYTLATGLGSGTHTVSVFKRTEPNQSGASPIFKGFVIDGGSPVFQPNPVKAGRKLEFWGDSITCGYGDLGTFPCSFSADTEDENQTYAFVTGRHFNSEVHVEAWSGKGVVRNYGAPTTTSPDPMPIYLPLTCALESNKQWDWSRWVPNAVVINLGTNDYSTDPVPPTNVFEQGYLNMTSLIRAHYPPSTFIFTVCGPLISGTCCTNIQDVVKQLNNGGDKNVIYVDMQNILVMPQDYGCDYHPSVSGHQKMANILIPVIQKALGW